jgi:hypothetical protein
VPCVPRAALNGVTLEGIAFANVCASVTFAPIPAAGAVNPSWPVTGAPLGSGTGIAVLVPAGVVGIVTEDVTENVETGEDGDPYVG